MEKQNNDKIKLLLVEDDKDFSSALVSRFTKRDVDVTPAYSAEEALDKLKKDEIEVVVSDIKLPGMDGIEFLNRVREINENLPVILVTGYASLESAKKAVKLNAADYLLKPLESIDELLDPIYKAVHSYKLLRENRRLTDNLQAKINELKLSEHKYRDLFESASDIIYTVDNEGVITSVNKRMEEVTKYSKKELVGRSSVELIASVEEGLHYKKLRKILGGKSIDMLEVKIVAKGGKERVGEMGMRPIKEGGKIVGAQCIFHDITERKKAEEELEEAYRQLKETHQQLIQSTKMAAMGRLAAGISHELNQPLTGIKGFAQAAVMDLGKNSPLKEDLDRIIEQADRMDNIIQNVRFFARKSEFKPEEFNINKPIRDSLTLLSEQLRVHNIRVKKSLGKKLPRIKGNFNQFQQVFLNLMINAKDAIDSLERPAGGKLTIKTALSENKKNIEIAFEDTGCGIAKEHFDNIFDPFFTTKSPNGGTGLGLPIIYRIIEDHKGTIKVESEEGKGTTFRIKLPVA